MMQGYTEMITSRPSSVTDVHVSEFRRTFELDLGEFLSQKSEDGVRAACDATFILDSNDYCAIERVVDGPESLNRIVSQFCSFNASHPLLMNLPQLSHGRGITRYMVSIFGGSPARPPTKRLSNLQFDALMGNLVHALIQNHVSPLSIACILRSAERTRRKLVKKSLNFSNDPCIIL